MTLQEQIQARAPFDSGAMVVRFVVVVDWAKPDGTRWVSRIGSEDLTEWERDGLLHHALNGNWEGTDVEMEDL
jgi:hypothetical protein